MLREKAKTYDAGSEDEKNLLLDSTKRLNALNKYAKSDWSGASYLAKVYEADNHLALNDPKTALEVITDVIEIKPGNPAQRRPGHLWFSGGSEGLAPIGGL